MNFSGTTIRVLVHKDYLRMKDAGVQFLAEPQFMEGWGMRCTYFRDPEGNLFELNDASTV